MDPSRTGRDRASASTATKRYDLELRRVSVLAYACGAILGWASGGVWQRRGIDTCRDRRGGRVRFRSGGDVGAGG